MGGSQSTTTNNYGKNFANESSSDKSKKGHGDTRDGMEFVNQWSVNDTVKILSDVEKVKTYQEDHGGWNPDMRSVLGETGTIKYVLPDGDLVVSVSGKIVLFNPLCCEKASRIMLSEEEDLEMLVPVLSMNSDFTDLLRFSQEHTEDFEIQFQKYGVGDTVKIIDRVQKVKKYQDGHGGWIDIMKTILGEKAVVKVVLPNADLLVLMPGSMWRLNPKCCEDVSDSDDSININDSDDTVNFNDIYDSIDFNDIDDRVNFNDSDDTVNFNDSDDRVNFNDSDDSDSDSRPIIQESPKNALFQKSIPKDLDTIVQSASSSEIGNVPEFIRSVRSKIEVKSSNRTTLQVASGKGHEDIVSLLLEAGENLEIQDDDGDTALHYSSWGATKMIVEKHRDIVDVKKDDGFTALHVAAMNGYKDIIKTLLTVGQVQIDIRCTSQMTPLHLAVRECYMGSIKLLISNGADINAKDEDGNTCLHLAVSNRKKTIRKDSEILKKVRTQFNLGKDEPDWFVIACYLVYHGGKRHRENKRGKTPLDIIKDESLREKLRNFALKSTSKQPKKDHAAGPQSNTTER